MRIEQDLLAHTAHREYPMPEEQWKYYQEWHNTVFFHWKVPYTLIKKYLPPALEPDTFDNTAWVSLVAFEVKKMRMRNLPVLPYISNFHEINVRTYVIKDGIRGIYMFSIETDKFIEVLISRAFIGLPYEKAIIKRTGDHLFSYNPEKNNCLNIVLEYTSIAIEKSALDLWLTERYFLYQFSNTALYRYDIHHKEWPLKRLEAAITIIRYTAGQFTFNLFPDKSSCCRKLEVLLWARKKIL
jgi:uncharacterized protein